MAIPPTPPPPDLPQRPLGTPTQRPMAFSHARPPGLPQYKSSSDLAATMTPPDPIRAHFAELTRRTYQTEIPCFEPEEINHQFADIPCPHQGAISGLHANVVGKPTIIASQDPHPDDLERFWEAVAERRATIIDLTSRRDHTTPYHPVELDQTVRYGAYSVTLIEQSGSFRTYAVEKPGEAPVSVTRYVYHEWADNGVISAVELTRLVDQATSIRGTLWIHCRAGIGRTGTLITAIVLQERIREGAISQETLLPSLTALIWNLRQQRGPHFVQNEQQFRLLVDFAIFLFSQRSSDSKVGP